MDLDAAHHLARDGRLYPSVILDGGDDLARQAAAVALGRTLLCLADADQPCGACRSCQRIAWPDGDEAAFHPDFRVLERDRRTATSAEATKAFLQAAYQAPFEAPGQVFVVAEANTLTPEAADALLKLLEEPPKRTPRHFLLLASTRRDLLPTLRSRSLCLFLGPAAAIDPALVERVADAFGAAIDRYVADRSPVDLLVAAEALGQAKGWEDPRARRPWATASAAVVADLRQRERAPAVRRRLLALATDLLDAPRWRVRGIIHGRLIEGLLARRLGV